MIIILVNEEVEVIGLVKKLLKDIRKVYDFGGI